MRKEKTIKHEPVFAIVMAVFLVICPWVTYMKIHALDEQEQKVFEQYGGYAGMVLISSFLSEHEGIAKNGTPSQGEGYWVLLAYAVLCLGAMNCFSSLFMNI